MMVQVSESAVSESAEAVRSFGTGLGKMFLQRGPEIRSMLVASIAGEHILLLGPPGTAKSALTLAFAGGIGWRSFVRLVGRTTVPEELFGPFSLLGLESDRFERVTGGYLPTAEVAFVDEVFKASSAILNSLLTILQERAFDNGTTRNAVPLRICVAASNELPQEEGLGALYDRFMLRHWVDYLTDEDAFAAMLGTGIEIDAPTCDPRHFDLLRSAMPQVKYDHLIPTIVQIRRALMEEKVIASDRRWRKAIGLVKASALLDGRLTATRRDLAVLADCLWDRPADRDSIRATVAKFRNPELADAERLLAVVREKIAGAPNLATPDLKQMGVLTKLLAELDEAFKESQKIDRTDPEVAAVVDAIKHAAVAFARRAAEASGSIKI